MGGLRKRVAAVLSDAVDEDWSRFDLAAACYSMLLDVIENEAAFISGFYLADGSQNPNPNLLALAELERKLAAHLAGPNGDFIDRASAYEAIRTELSSFHLEPFRSSESNEATLIWSLIKAIDRSCTEDRLLRTRDQTFPLNQVFRDRVGVYFSTIPESVCGFFDQSRISRIPELTLNGQLENLLFYDCPKDKVYPGLSMATRRLRADGNLAYRHLIRADQMEPIGLVHDEDSIIGGDDGREQVLRIGLELFCGAQIAGWKGTSSPITFVNTDGDNFEVEYSSNYAELFGPLVRQSIDNAVASGCDMLVFPELVVSPVLAEVISEHLGGLSNAGRLMLVVAGSGWYDRSDGCGGNNVCKLFDNRGVLLGRTFKASPVITKQEVDGGAYERIEDLANPGGELTVVDVEGIGRVITAVCKDLVSDARRPIDLARDLGGFVLLVPTMSDSLDRGFGIQLELLSARNLAVSCVCNLCSTCEARGNGNDQVTVGLVSIPTGGSPHPKQANPEIIPIHRDSVCQQRCEEDYLAGAPQSCLWVVEVSSNPLDGGLDASVERVGRKP